MMTLVVGASGATGKQLVKQLLNMGQNVKVIVRSAGKIPESWKSDNNVTVIEAGINDLDIDQLAGYIKECDAVASCLGHNLSFKGIYGKPRKLVTHAVIKLCEAIDKNKPAKPVKFVLMNTVGNSNRDLNEPLSSSNKFVVSLLRVLLPPHSDNEDAADYLRVNIGQNYPVIEWVAVRPDTLIDNDQVTPYALHASPVRSAIFNPGKTSRINVGNFVAKLITENEIWKAWKGQMPVIYNMD